MRKIGVKVPTRCNRSCPLIETKFGYYKCKFRRTWVTTWHLEPVKKCRDAEVS